MNNLIDKYKKIYSLPKYSINEINSNTIAFVFFDKEGNIYLLNDNKYVNYSVNLSLNMIDMINNIEKIYKFEIINYYTLCYVNTNSILVACKIKNKSDYLVLSDKINKNVKELIKEKLDDYSEIYNDEYLLMERYSNRYRFYKKYIKKYILTEKRRKKREYISLIKKLIGEECKSIIDISCGDCGDILNLFNEIPLVIGNDINLYLQRKNQDKYNGAIITNDNMLDLAYIKGLFDVSYCKNTIHHFNDNKEIITAIKNLYNISNKIILVEIEDPEEVGGLSRFLNKYLYCKFLKDAAKNFIGFDEFKNIIDSNFETNCKISYLSFKNILGKYMIAVIEKREL